MPIEGQNQMSDDQKFEVSSSVVAREVGGEMMLMDLESGTYFGLDPVGMRIWQSLEDGHTTGQLLERLEREFDVTPEQLREDVATLFQTFRDHNLITQTSA